MEAFVGDLSDKAKSEEELAKALQGVQLALIPAGVPRKPGMTRDDLFNTNAGTHLSTCVLHILMWDCCCSGAHATPL